MKIRRYSNMPGAYVLRKISFENVGKYSFDKDPFIQGDVLCWYKNAKIYYVMTSENTYRIRRVERKPRKNLLKKLPKKHLKRMVKHKSRSHF